MVPDIIGVMVARSSLQKFRSCAWEIVTFRLIDFLKGRE